MLTISRDNPMATAWQWGYNRHGRAVWTRDHGKTLFTVMYHHTDQREEWPATPADIVQPVNPPQPFAGCIAWP